MSSLIIRYQRYLVSLALVLVLLPFSPFLIHWLTDGSQGGGQTSDNGNVVPTYTPPASVPYTVVHLCLDTPPNYSPSLAHLAAVAVANRIDELTRENIGGLVLYTSWIRSHSYHADALPPLTVPAISPFAAPPSPPVYGSDAFHNKLLKDAYDKAHASWHVTFSQQQKKVTLLQAQVRRETNKLRSLVFPYDNLGSDPRSCIFEATQHLMNVHGYAKKVLLIASTMLSTVSEQETGSFSLSGIDVKIFYHTCLLSTPADCSALDRYWDQYLRRAGSRSVTFFDVQQSQAFPEQVTF